MSTMPEFTIKQQTVTAFGNQYDAAEGFDRRVSELLNEGWRRVGDPVVQVELDTTTTTVFWAFAQVLEKDFLPEDEQPSLAAESLWT